MVVKNIINLGSGKIKHVGFNLLCEIIIGTFAEKVFGFFIDLKRTLPPPGLISSGCGSDRTAYLSDTQKNSHNRALQNQTEHLR